MFSILSILVVLAAVFSFINVRYLKLPTTVGVMLISLLASLALVAAGEMAAGLRHYAGEVVGGIDFHVALLHGMLAFFLVGALISPTDPVAVLAIMKAAGAPKDLETQVAGESLFNDGVGVVAFLALLAVAAGKEPPTFGAAAILLVRQAVGGALVGFAAGGVTYQFLKRVDQYQVELLLTLGLAMGSYALADELEMSAPIAAVLAGLVIGNE